MHCPLTKRTKKPSVVDKGWLTEGIKVWALNLKSMHAKWKISSDTNFKDYYRAYKKVYERVIKVAKQNDFNERLSKAKNLSKESWRIVNGYRDTSTKVNININTSDNQTITDPSEVANFLNKEFLKNSENTVVTRKCQTPTRVCQTIFLAPVSEEETLKTIKSLKKLYISRHIWPL